MGGGNGVPGPASLYSFNSSHVNRFRLVESQEALLPSPPYPSCQTQFPTSNSLSVPYADASFLKYWQPYDGIYFFTFRNRYENASLLCEVLLAKADCLTLRPADPPYHQSISKLCLLWRVQCPLRFTSLFRLWAF